MIARGAFVVATLCAAGIQSPQPAPPPIPMRPSIPTAAPAPFDLPAPTGALPIGATSWHVTDDTRKETFTGSGKTRQVHVLAWYPATSSSTAERAPYLREGLTEVSTFATLLRSPGVFDDLARVQTHATLDATPAASPAKFPVLVFSHGYTGIPSSHTTLVEDLASHGYAVLSIVHPYESTAALLADGQTVTMVDETSAPRQALRDVFGEWSVEDSTMKAVTSAKDEDEQLRLLRGYLAGLQKTNEALRRWVDDTRLVLDRLPAPAARNTGATLATRLDMESIGVLGHSMGGVTAGQFCVDDQRCKAGLNLDGIPQYGSMIDNRMKRPFLMVYSARHGHEGASDAIYKRAASPYYRVDVRDTLHLEFSDMVLYGGPLRERKMLGAIAPQRAIEITRAIVREYFDQELRGQRSSLLAGQVSFPEVSIQHFPATER